VGAGGQGRFTAPAAGAPDEQRRRAKEQGLREEEEEEWSQGPFCKIKEIQGLHCKELVTFKPMLKWRWSKKQ
jgi:hypothetical protein